MSKMWCSKCNQECPEEGSYSNGRKMMRFCGKCFEGLIKFKAELGQGWEKFQAPVEGKDCCGCHECECECHIKDSDGHTSRSEDPLESF